jgi:hypothetical protein
MDSYGTTSAPPGNTDKAVQGLLYPPIGRPEFFVAFFTAAQKGLKSADSETDKERNAPGKPGS